MSGCLVSSLQPAPLVLAIDTSSSQASYVLQRAHKTLAALVVDNGMQHSHTFLGHLNVLLDQAGVILEEVKIIAAVTGPGSFTGLRVGLAAVQGLAHTLQVPALGLTTLDVLALAANVSGRVVILQTTSREEVFIGVREFNQNGRFVVPQADQAGRLEQVWGLFFQPAWRVDSLVITGSGVLQYQEWLLDWSHSQGVDLGIGSQLEIAGALWQGLTTLSPLSLTLARYIANQYHEPQLNELTESHRLEACYIRPSDAELKLIA